MNTDAGRLVEAEELVMAPEGTFMQPAAMTPVTRTIGSNDVGVVAWLLTMKTPECPQGRQVWSWLLQSGPQPTRSRTDVTSPYDS